MDQQQAQYGNWIRLRVVLIFLAIGLGLIGLSLLPIPMVARIVLWILAAAPLLMGLYLVYVYIQFATWGGGYQQKLWHLLLDQLAGVDQGRALDVGTGAGALAITLAQRYPALNVVGIDLWGTDWEYGQAQCERNARLTGVDVRVIFQQASADSLPFDDATFDHVVSHFVFHEVSSASDKREVIREALRVLRPGGTFSFQDMFHDQEMYGSPDDLVDVIRSWGISEVTFLDTQKELAIPRLLRNPRTLGLAAILHGRK